ncbi:MAG: hypothetical protein JXJ04_26830 [Spirochaetales bacterium]|nr:hypothetical protein [Spirochaetales bacterium]
MDNLFLCKVCGHIEFNAAPEKCPVCGAPKSSFALNAEAVMPAEKEGKEKHVPVIITTNACGLIPDECKDAHIKVGSTPHPMQEDHWIQWIDIYINKKFSARYMMFPQSLQATIGIHIKSNQTGTLQAIEHCNKHGSWMAEASL